MAPDPKEVRIGSHVEYHGDMCRVSYIAPKDKIYQFYLRRKDYPFDIHAHVFEVNPIPITEELLSEIGFVNTSSTSRIVYTKGCEYDGMWIEVKTLKDRWEVFVSDNDWDGRIVVRYLHELEAFLYLTTKQELIND